MEKMVADKIENIKRDMQYAMPFEIASAIGDLYYETGMAALDEKTALECYELAMDRYQEAARTSAPAYIMRNREKFYKAYRLAVGLCIDDEEVEARLQSKLFKFLKLRDIHYFRSLFDSEPMKK